MLCFFRGPIPSRGDCINTAPHPSREAFVVIVTCGSPWLIRLYAVGRLVTHHLRSIMASLDKPMVLSKFCLCNFTACVLSISRNLWCSGPYITPGKLAVISPNTWATILIEGDKVASRFSQACLNFRILSEVRETCIKMELRTNPKKVIICVGSRTDFSGGITKPTLSSNQIVSMTFLVNRLKLLSAVNHESSIYIYTTEMCPCCLRLEKTGFCSFVNFWWQRANPLGKQTNWYKTPFHSNLRNFWWSLHIGTE